MKNKVIVAFFVMAAIFSLITISPTIFTLGKIDASKQKLIANHIFDEVNQNIGTPIIVATGMKSDNFLKNVLLNESNLEKEEIEKDLAGYLKSVSESFGYVASFVVSDKTRRYYTPNGITKLVNPATEPYDIWYQLFVDSEEEVSLDTDRDQNNDYRWTIFVNAKIRDDDGNLLGICGVGLFMDDLQKIVEKAENDFNVKVNLVDDEGLVQVDTDQSNIENAYISEAILDKAGAKEFSYTELSSGGFRMTRYMETLGWFLVVQGSVQDEDVKIRWELIFTYFFLILALFVILFGKRDKTVHELLSSSLKEDPLTGFPNRNYLRESFGELGIFNTTRYKSLAMLDIDKFKNTNETRDGDEIIANLADTIRRQLDERGIVFRWSGDEFVFFLEMDAQESEEMFVQLLEKIKKTEDVTASVGVVKVNLSESIKTNYHRAVQLCYAAKEAGGNQVRRQS